MRRAIPLLALLAAALPALLAAAPQASAATPGYGGLVGFLPEQSEVDALEDAAAGEAEEAAGVDVVPERPGGPCVSSVHNFAGAGLGFCADRPADLLYRGDAEEPGPAAPAEPASEGPAPAPDVAEEAVPERGEAVLPLEAEPAQDEAGEGAPAPTEPGPAPGAGPRAASAVPAPRQESRWILAAAAAAAATAILAGPAALLLKGLLVALRRRARDSPLRHAILAAVAADPGVHHAELRRRVGVANGTLEHHLRRLLAAGAVACVRTPGYTCYFPAGFDRAPEVARARTPLRHGSARRLADLLAEGEASLSALVGRAGMRPSTVHYHVERLVRSGLVSSVRRGRERRLALTEAGAGLVGARPRPSGARRA